DGARVEPVFRGALRTQPLNELVGVIHRSELGLRHSRTLRHRNHVLQGGTEFDHAPGFLEHDVGLRLARGRAVDGCRWLPTAERYPQREWGSEFGLAVLARHADEGHPVPVAPRLRINLE